MTNTRTLKPVAYFKATEKHGILWGEDCCCADPVYSDYEDHEGEEVVNLAVYPAAAYEALQKEVTHWKANHADLKERLHVATHRTDLPSDRLPLFDKMKAENAAQAKRIADLEAQISSQMNFGERMIIDLSDGNVIGDETGRVVAKFSHWNEAESFCEAANFKYSASKNGE